MYWETLPQWIWIVFYGFLLLTLCLAVFCIIQSRMQSWSIIAIMVIFTAPVTGILNSIGRGDGINEFEHLVLHLQQGSWWAIYLLICFIYLLFWWWLFLKSKK